MSRIDEIKARAEAATPGPWGEFIAGELSSGDCLLYFDLDETTKLVSEDDLYFAKHAREDIPWLISEVERLLKENAELNRDIDYPIVLERVGPNEFVCPNVYNHLAYYHTIKLDLSSFPLAFECQCSGRYGYVSEENPIDPENPQFEFEYTHDIHGELKENMQEVLPIKPKNDSCG